MNQESTTVEIVEAVIVFAWLSLPLLMIVIDLIRAEREDRSR